MAIRKPLVMQDGSISQLSVGDEIEMIVPIGHGTFLQGTQTKEKIIGNQTYLRSGEIQASLTSPVSAIVSMQIPYYLSGNYKIIQVENPDDQSGDIEYFLIKDSGIVQIINGIIKASIDFPVPFSGGNYLTIHVRSDRFFHIVGYVYIDGMAVAKSVLGAMQWTEAGRKFVLDPNVPMDLMIHPTMYFQDPSILFGYLEISGSWYPTIDHRYSSWVNKYAALAAGQTRTEYIGAVITPEWDEIVYWVVYEGSGSARQIALYYTNLVYDEVLGNPALSRLQLSSGSYENKQISGSSQQRKSSPACFIERLTSTTWRFHWFSGTSITPTQTSMPSIGDRSNNGIWQNITYINDGDSALPLYVYAVYNGASESTSLHVIKPFGDTGTWIDLLPLITDLTGDIYPIPSSKHFYFLYQTDEVAVWYLARYNTTPGMEQVEVMHILSETTLLDIADAQDMPYVLEKNQLFGYIARQVIEGGPPYILSSVFVNAVGSVDHTPNLYFRIE